MSHGYKPCLVVLMSAYKGDLHPKRSFHPKSNKPFTKAQVKKFNKLVFRRIGEKKDLKSILGELKQEFSNRNLHDPRVAGKINMIEHPKEVADAAAQPNNGAKDAAKGVQAINKSANRRPPPDRFYSTGYC